ncbi:unnamed protein product, partial [Mesorhabditis belari]|uniref:Protein kinase domain-containing protein n=1 Tax=Mesorhabditis belari TaxID=2138241 RepID=A0AAF3EGX7_9BILA
MKWFERFREGNENLDGEIEEEEREVDRDERKSPQMIPIGGGSYGNAFRLENYEPPIAMKEVNYSSNLVDQSNEMKILKELVHENIVRYIDQPIDFDYNGEKFPIFMEYCEEGSLRNVIADVTLNYSVSTIIKWAKEIFNALIYLKGERIAHRDVKPGNIFVTRDFELKLGDFGVFTRFENGKEMRIEEIGTRFYMAPELNGDITKLTEEDIYQCDIYASGLVLWEIVTRDTLSSSSLSTLQFPSTTSTDVRQLLDLIQRCSSPNISIKKRATVEEAMRETKLLIERFTNFIEKPYRNRNQKHLMIPDAACALFPNQLICALIKEKLLM